MNIYQTAATCNKICTWGNFFLQEFYACIFIIKLMPLFGVQTAVGIRNILFSTPIQTGLGPTSLLCIVSWVKQLGSSVDNPPPSGDEIKNEKTYNCTFPLCQSWPVMGITRPYFFLSTSYTPHEIY